MEAEEKEKLWLMKRCGKITSSAIGKLMVSGRREMTPSELEVAKKQGVKRKTVDVPFGDTAISYLYQVARERRLNKPCRHISTSDMEWGKDHEKDAIECFNHNTFSILMSCADDFDEIVFVDNIYDGYGDSPDGYGFDVNGKLSYIAEVKCFTSESKIEYLREATKEQAIEEYYWQLMSHFLSHPDVDKMYYIVYDGKSDDDPFDLRLVNDPSRLLYWELNRCDYKDDIDRMEDKLQMALAYLSLNERDAKKYPISKINDFVGVSNTERVIAELPQKVNNMSTNITLSKESSESEIKAYFNEILKLSQSDNEFPVNFDDVWMLVYQYKHKAVNELKEKFIENVDYQAITQKVECKNGVGYSRRIDYYITVPCLEFFIARKARSVFEIYRQVFHHTVNKVIEDKSIDNQPTISDKMNAATWAAKFLNLNDNSKLIIAKQILGPLNISLPDYTSSKGILKSASELLSEKGIKISAQAFNKAAIEKGYLCELSRNSSHGKKKRFKSITEKGLSYGENQVSPNNPKETQPLWYEDKFEDLLSKLL